MSARKLLAQLAAMLAGALFAGQCLAAEVQMEAAGQRQIGALTGLRATPAVTGARLTGKRPPLMAQRPGWLVNLAGDVFFMSRFELAFDRLDKNHDGLLQWAYIDAQGKLHPDQAGAEPLPASYDACYLVDYLHHPAKTEKDPAHPGQYIQTAESYEITGWQTWKEALAVLGAGGYPAYSPTGVCNKTEKKVYCKKGALEFPRVCTWGQCNCYPGLQGATLIEKEVCVDQQTVVTAFTREQWLKQAKDHFKREDWNHDGKLSADEAQEFVCPAE